MDSIKALLSRMVNAVSMVPEEECTKKIDLGIVEICSTPGRESLFSSAPTPDAELASVVQDRDVTMSGFGAFK